MIKTLATGLIFLFFKLVKKAKAENLDDVKRYKRSADDDEKEKKEEEKPKDLSVNLRVIRCYHRGCIPPPLPMDLRKMPDNRELWSDPGTWVNFTHNNLPPQDWDNLTVPIGKSTFGFID